MTEQSDVQTWAPEGASRVGVPPVNGKGGERGTSALPDEHPAKPDGAEGVSNTDLVVGPGSKSSSFHGH